MSFIGIGGLLGAIVGYYSKCSSGTCPLTATPWRGALWGAFLGLIMSLSFLQNGPYLVAEESKDVIEITKAKEFDTQITNSDLVVVDFYATWCPPCKALSPIYSNLATKYTGKIKFLRVDVDKNNELARRYKIESIPCVIFFQKQKEISRIVGLEKEPVYVEKIESLLK